MEVDVNGVRVASDGQEVELFGVQPGNNTVAVRWTPISDRELNTVVIYDNTANYLHLLQVNISHASTHRNSTSGKVIASWAPLNPPLDSGLHQYTVALYRQPDRISPLPYRRDAFPFQQFVNEFNLSLVGAAILDFQAPKSAKPLKPRRPTQASMFNTPVEYSVRPSHYDTKPVEVLEWRSTQPTYEVDIIEPQVEYEVRTENFTPNLVPVYEEVLSRETVEVVEPVQAEYEVTTSPFMPREEVEVVEPVQTEMRIASRAPTQTIRPRRSEVAPAPPNITRPISSPHPISLPRPIQQIPLISRGNDYFFYANMTDDQLLRLAASEGVAMTDPYDRPLPSSHHF